MTDESKYRRILHRKIDQHSADAQKWRFVGWSRDFDPRSGIVSTPVILGAFEKLNATLS